MRRLALALLVVFVALAGFVRVATRSLAAEPFPSPTCTPGLAPVVNGLTNTGVGGGEIFATGKNLTDAEFWLIEPGSTPSILTSITAAPTTASVLAPAGLTPGTAYDIVVSDPTQACVATWYPGLLAVGSCMTPSVIAGTDLKAEYVARHALCSGTCAATGPYAGNCTSGAAPTYVCDETGNGNHVTFNGTGCTMNAPDLNYSQPNTWSIHCPPGASNYAQKTSFALGSAGTGIWFGETLTPNATSAGGNYYINYINTGAQVFWGTYTTSGTWNTYLGVGSTFITGTVTQTTGVPAILLGGTDGGTMSISVNNETPTTGASGAAIANTKTLSIPQTTATQGGDWVQIDVFDRALSTTESTEYTQCQNLTWGATKVPTVTAATQALVATSGACSTITGTNFEPGATVTIGGGIGAATVVASGTTWIQITLPTIAVPGHYDVTVTNPDGLAGTTTSVLQVNSTVTVENTLCTLEWGHWEGQFTCTSPPCVAGGAVSSWLDYSGLGNNENQATGADQPLIQSLTDSDFNGYPSLVSSGSPTLMQSPTPMQAAVTPPTALWIFAVVKMNSIAAESMVAWYHGGTRLQCTVGVSVLGQPSTVAGSTTVTWGTSIGTTNAAYLVCRQSSTISGINVNSGTEVTASNSGFTFANDYLEAMAGTGAPIYFTGKIAFLALAGGDPNSTQLAAMNTYVQKFGGSL